MHSLGSPVTNTITYALTAVLLLCTAGRLGADTPFQGSPGPGDSVTAPPLIAFGTVPFDSCARKDDSIRVAQANSGMMALELSLKKGSAYRVIGNLIDTLDGRVRQQMRFAIMFCPTRDTTCPSDTLIVRYRLTADSLDTGQIVLIPISGCGGANRQILSSIPGQLDFGHPGTDSCVTRQVTIVGTPGAAVTGRLSITGTAANSYAIVSPQSPTVTIDSSLLVTIQYCPQPGDADSAFAFLRVGIDSGGQSASLLDVPLSGTTDPLSVPRVIDFGTRALGTCADTMIIVRNYTRRSLVITSYTVDSTIGRFTIEGNSRAQLGIGETASVSIRFCPDSAGRRRAQWHIDTLPAAGIMVVDLVGEGGQSLLDIRPDPVAFRPPDPATGNCSEDTVHIVNIGTTTCVVDSLMTDRAEFTVLSPRNLPQTVIPGETLHVVLRFCSNSSLPVTGALAVIVAGDRPRFVTLIGQPDTSTGGTGLLVSTAASVDFGPVLVGQSLLQTIVLKNRGRGSVPLDSSIAAADPPFRIAGASGSGPIGPGDSVVITVEFRPIDTGNAAGTWRGFIRGSAAPIVVGLRGYGVGRRLWIDTVEARVGDEAEISLGVSPPLVDRDTVRRIRALVTYDPRSIVPIAARSTVGSARLEQVNDSTFAIELSAPPSAFITGRNLVSAVFVGLTSARPVSIVRILDDSLIAFATPIAAGNGMVRLEGCDIGRDPLLSRMTRLNALRMTGDDALLLEYRVPMHAVVRLAIVDLSGREVRRYSLPEGDDTDRVIRVELAELPSGSYLLDLQAGSDRAGTMIHLP